MQELLNKLSTFITHAESKSSRFYYSAAVKRRLDDPVKAQYYEGKYVAYRDVAETLHDIVNEVTKYTGTVDELKQQMQEIGVAEWIEAGCDILKIGDNWLNDNLEFARLDVYRDFNALHFCGYYSTIYGKCGQITLNNGKIICYNIHQEPEEN